MFNQLFTSGLLRLSLSYIPSERLWARSTRAASARTYGGQRRPFLVRFCKRVPNPPRDLAGWAAAAGTWPWGPSPPPARRPTPPRRRRRTSSPSTPTPSRRPLHLAVVAARVRGDAPGLAAAAGARHLAAGTDPSPDRVGEAFSGKSSGHFSNPIPLPPNHVAAARPADAPAPRRRRRG